MFGRFDVRLANGKAFQVGTARFVALALEHTPESTSYAVHPKDTENTCSAVLTRDCLFVGDTGRTDLPDPDNTGENAGLLHNSVHQKIVPLGDQAFIFPTHGFGSACGGNISERDNTIVGIEN